MERVTGVSFDIWNTLLGSNPAFKQERSAIIARLYGVALGEALGAADVVDAAFNAQTERTAIDAGCEDRLAAIAHELGKAVPPVDILQRAGDEIQALFLQFPPMPLEGDITLSTLRALRESHIPVYLVSNTGFIRGQTMRGALQLLDMLEQDGAAIFSNECGGIAKPSPAIFKLLERFGADLSTTLHVGDNVHTDYEGALSAGMQAVLLDRKKDATELAGDGVVRVHSIAEIPSFVGVHMNSAKTQ